MGARQHYPGFTLIELAIVLVIIGLIVGGVLVGRDLIATAEIRATIKQIEDFNTAVNAFRNKYNCLPGDCATAEDFGFDAASKGNGDGIIGVPNIAACSGGLGLTCPLLHEHVDFWYHLSAANLIAGTIKPYYLIPQTNPESSFATGRATPPVKLTSLKDSGGWAIYNFQDGQFGLYPAGTPLGKTPNRGFMLSSSALPDIGIATVAGYFSTSNIHAIDTKVDDGMPLTGTARAWSFASGVMFWIEHPAIGVYDYGCITNDPVPLYNLQYTGSATNPHATFEGDSLFGLCSLMLQASF